VEELKKRQKEVLGIIVDTYVETVNPVGSKAIAQRFHDQFSSATIRNEMQNLETLAYITHPHTSAGRIPTDKGYRYYVDHLMSEPKVNDQDLKQIDEEYKSKMLNMETLIKRTCRILSTLSFQAGIVSFPLFEELTLKRVELTSLGSHYIHVVWLTENGFIQDRVVDMKEEISEEDLLRLSRFLNEELRGMLLHDIDSYLKGKLENAQDSLRQLFVMAQTIISSGFPKAHLPDFHVEGSHHVLNQPEFRDWQKSRQLFTALDQADWLADVMENTVRAPGVRVRIGTENACPDLWDCSVIMTHYSVQQRPVGTLGILGPRRMSYQRLVSLVDHVAQRFGEVLEQW